MFNKIISIQEIKQKKESVLQSEKEVCSPLLTDYSQIPLIYEWFKNYMNRQDCPPNPDSVNQRKKFIFVILYLYAPASILGYKMPNGLRAKIAVTLGVQKHCSVSMYCEDLIFLSQHYKGFRSDIEDVFRYICSRLTAAGLIRPAAHDAGT